MELQVLLKYTQDKDGLETIKNLKSTIQVQSSESGRKTEGKTWTTKESKASDDVVVTSQTC